MYKILIANIDAKRPDYVSWGFLKNTDGTDFSTADLAELTTKFTEQLSVTPKNNILAVEDLTVTLTVKIEDSTPSTEVTPGGGGTE